MNLKVKNFDEVDKILIDFIKGKEDINKYSSEALEDFDNSVAKLYTSEPTDMTSHVEKFLNFDIFTAKIVETFKLLPNCYTLFFFEAMDYFDKKHIA
jgi:hypothetical protein